MSKSVALRKKEPAPVVVATMTKAEIVGLTEEEEIVVRGLIAANRLKGQPYHRRLRREIMRAKAMFFKFMRQEDFVVCIVVCSTGHDEQEDALLVGTTKFNPNDAKGGTPFSPRMGRHNALRRAITHGGNTL
jgi:hypothetical protein